MDHRCLIGCACGRHQRTNKPCIAGCQCGRHASYPRRPPGYRHDVKTLQKMREKRLLWWASHPEAHIASSELRRKPRPDPQPCACNCGQIARPGKKFVRGHHVRGRTVSAETREKLRQRMLGTHPSEATRQKLSESHRGQQTWLGRHHTPESRAKISLNNNGGRKPETWTPSLETRILWSQQRRGRKLSEHTKQKLRSKRLEGAYRNSRGYPTSKICHDEDRLGRVWTFRSTWELRAARLLDHLELITWFYEPKVLLLTDGRTYTPDFWVEEWNRFVEIKGWSRGKRDLSKVKAAIHDGVPIEVVLDISEWEIKNLRAAQRRE